MKTYNKLSEVYLFFASMFIPVFLLVFPGQVFPATRFFVLFVFVVLGFLLWAARNFLCRGMVIVKTNFYLPFFAFFALVILSLVLLQAPGSFNDAFFGTAGLFLFVMTFFLVLIHVGVRENIKQMVVGVSCAFILVYLLVLLSFLGVIDKVIPVQFFSGAGFLTGENFYYLLVFFLSGLVFAAHLFVNNKKRKIFFGITAIFSFLGIVLLIINYLKVGNAATFLPFAAGWSATIEIFKNFQYLLLGIGFNQFGLFSSLLRTPELMQDKFVFLRFPQTSNGFFELVNSLGILGLLAFGFFVYKIFSAIFTKGFDLKQVFQQGHYLFPIVVVVLSFFFLPISPIVLFLLFFFFAILTISLKEAKAKGFEETKVQLVVPEGEGFLSFQTGEKFEKYQSIQKIFASFTVLLFLIIFYFFTAFPVIAESHFYRYLLALSENRGSTAYTQMTVAAYTNPKNDGYFAELSRVDFQLALSLNAQKKLTDDDKRNVTTLVQESVAAASRATQINPSKVSNWENLASIYQALITTDAQAANLSANAYLRAVQLAPQDPMLRLRFAQMLYAAKFYADAINQLNTAISMKSDFANAYYNLGLNYKALKQKENAKKSFDLALNFVKKGSEDAKILTAEIKKLDEEVEEIVEEASESAGIQEESKLNAPTPAPRIENVKTNELKLATESGKTTQ